MASLKTVCVLLAVCLVASLAVGVYAAVLWEQRIQWAWSQAIESFEVEGNQVVNYGELISNSSVIKIESYNVTNTGNVDVTVKPDVQTTGSVSIAWDKQSALVRVGGSVMFNLTLTISGEGSCLVKFLKA